MRIFSLIVIALLLAVGYVAASPFPAATPCPDPVFQRNPLSKRADPYFPPDPPSCGLCAADWPNVNNCAMASSVFANPAQILWSPQSFLAVIQCACADTFLSAFPQCVDCFIATNQTDVLTGSPDLPSVLNGIRQICALGSAVFQNGVTTSGSQTAVQPTPTNEGSMVRPWITAGAVVVVIGVLWTSLF